MRSLTHHRVGSHGHAGAVGQVVEDVGWFGQQVAAERRHVRSDHMFVFVLCLMSLCESDSLVLFQVQQEEASRHLQAPLQPVGVAALEQKGSNRSQEEHFLYRPGPATDQVPPQRSCYRPGPCPNRTL